MNNTIFYFTGTGNSLKIAKDISNDLPNCRVLSMAKSISNIHNLQPEGTVGFVFPVYYCGLPQLVREFLFSVDFNKVNYIFLVATYAKTLGAAGCISQAHKILFEKGKRLNSAFYVKTVDNFILWTWDVSPIKKHMRLHDNARIKAVKIAGIVNKKEENTERRFMEYLGPAIFGYKHFIKNVNKTDNSFSTNDSCNACGICARVCPVQNIDFKNKRPVWNNSKCQRCLACLHLCPKSSIQYNRVTIKRHRYHNPYIDINDLFLHNL